MSRTRRRDTTSIAAASAIRGPLSSAPFCQCGMESITPTSAPTTAPSASPASSSAGIPRPALPLGSLDAAMATPPSPTTPPTRLPTSAYFRCEAPCDESDGNLVRATDTGRRMSALSFESLACVRVYALSDEATTLSLSARPTRATAATPNVTCVASSLCASVVRRAASVPPRRTSPARRRHGRRSITACVGV